MHDLGRPRPRPSWLPQAKLIRFKALSLNLHLVGNNQKPPKTPVDVLEAQPYPSFVIGPSLPNRKTRKQIRHHHGAFLCWEASEALRLKCMLALFPDILPPPSVGVSYLPLHAYRGWWLPCCFFAVTDRLLPPAPELVLL